MSEQGSIVDEIMNKNRDGTTEIDAMKKSIGALQACDWGKVLKPMMTSCLCGVFTLRAGTGFFTLSDFLFTASQSIVVVHHGHSRDMVLTLFWISFLCLFIGALLGFVGVLTKKAQFVQFYVYALVFFLILFLVFTILSGAQMIPNLISWIISALLMWWKCSVANAYVNQLGGGQHSLLSG
eukprot:GEMP01042121.1.p1 GENE.GEMP01042121.1~~GEMP01042121.1.p1  ORF type:complete len:181 (+),score=41.72 GEMP01042121.1:110-652(+)